MGLFGIQFGIRQRHPATTQCDSNRCDISESVEKHHAYSVKTRRKRPNFHACHTHFYFREIGTFGLTHRVSTSSFSSHVFICDFAVPVEVVPSDLMEAIVMHQLQVLNQ